MSEYSARSDPLRLTPRSTRVFHFQNRTETRTVSSNRKIDQARLLKRLIAALEASFFEEEIDFGLTSIQKAQGTWTDYCLSVGVRFNSAAKASSTYLMSCRTRLRTLARIDLIWMRR